MYFYLNYNLLRRISLYSSTSLSVLMLIVICYQKIVQENKKHREDLKKLVQKIYNQVKKLVLRTLQIPRSILESIKTRIASLTSSSNLNNTREKVIDSDIANKKELPSKLLEK